MDAPHDLAQLCTHTHTHRVNHQLPLHVALYHAMTCIVELIMGKSVGVDKNYEGFLTIKQLIMKILDWLHCLLMNKLFVHLYHNLDCGWWMFIIMVGEWVTLSQQITNLKKSPF